MELENVLQEVNFVLWEGLSLAKLWLQCPGVREQTPRRLFLLCWEFKVLEFCGWHVLDLENKLQGGRYFCGGRVKSWKIVVSMSWS